MVNAKVKLTWAPSAVTAAIRREVKTAVRKGGERVRRETMVALNVSGKAATAKAKLNQGDEGERIARKKLIKNLKTITIKNKTIMFGGSYTYGKGKRRTTADRIYWYGEPLHRWVQSSVPGTPPHKQTGELQRRISVQPVNEGYRAKVGPANNLKYGRIQELGGKTRFGTLPARPYLEPSFQKMVPAIMQDFRVAIAKATS